MYSDIMRDAILTKYSLIKYYYTHLFQLSVYGGSPVYKPVFFEYPDDINAYGNLTNNVMIGDSLKVSVLADQLGQNYTQFYFPAGTWCNMLNANEACINSNG